MKYVLVKDVTVDSAVHTTSKFYETPTIIDISPKRMKIVNSVVELDLFGEAIISKNTIVYRNKFGEVFVVKVTKKALLVIGDKEYLFRNDLK